VPLEDDLLHPLALRCEDEVEVPRQNADLQAGPRLAEPVEKREQPHRRLRRERLAPAQQLDVTVELPPREEQALLRRQRRPIELAVVVGSVQQKPELFDTMPSPDVMRFDDAAHPPSSVA